MFKRLCLKELQAPENAIVLNEDVLSDCYRKNSRDYALSQSVLEAATNGQITGIVTDGELETFRRVVGNNSYNKFFSSVTSKNCMFLEVEVLDDIDDYRENPAYRSLFKVSSGCMGGLTSVIAAIESDRPLVTKNKYHWKNQNCIVKAYRERHAEDRAGNIIERKKTKDMQIFLPRDFYSLILPKLKI
jgi:hypothetical protein